MAVLFGVNWFVNLKTATKLRLFTGLMGIFLLVSSSIGMSLAKAMKTNAEAIYATDYRASMLAESMVIQRMRTARLVRDALLEPNLSRVPAIRREVDESAERFLALVTEAESVKFDETTRSELAQLRRDLPEYMALVRQALDLRPEADRTGDHSRIFTTLDAASKIGVSQMDAALQRIVERSKAHAARNAAELQDRYDQSWVQIFELIAVVTAAGVLVTRVIRRSICLPLADAVSVLERVAEGDLRARMDLVRRDELGSLATALNAGIDSMRSTLREVTDVSGEVSAASTEVASSSQTISSGAQNQAASLEETAASLEEISSTVKQNTESAQAAARLAEEARDAAERGGAVVGGAVGAMEDITRSSKKIADIIATIDEIAFQTNLLALNAAVEAARAGEQGRGFAVVASEVRTLAQRTGSAAKEIRGLIADSSAKVEAGTLQVNESGRTLDEIVRSVKRVTDMVADIASASREQSQGLDQISTAMAQVDHVTQSSASQTQELSSTAASLSDRATHLRRLVEAFQLGDESTPGTVHALRVTASPRRRAA